MSSIQPNQNPESHKVIRDKFPTEDENAHVDSLISNLRNAVRINSVPELNQTLAAFYQSATSGKLSEAHLEVLESLSGEHIGDGTVQTYMAQHYGVQAANIIAVKTAINGIDDAYHAQLELLKSTALAEKWSQSEFDQAYQALLKQAQSSVDSAKDMHDQAGEKQGEMADQGLPPDDSVSLGGGGSNPFGGLLDKFPQMFGQLNGLLGQIPGQAGQLLQGSGLSAIGQNLEKLPDTIGQFVQMGQGLDASNDDDSSDTPPDSKVKDVDGDDKDSKGDKDSRVTATKNNFTNDLDGSSDTPNLPGHGSSGDDGTHPLDLAISTK